MSIVLRNSDCYKMQLSLQRDYQLPIRQKIAITTINITNTHISNKAYSANLYNNGMSSAEKKLTLKLANKKKISTSNSSGSSY